MPLHTSTIRPHLIRIYGILFLSILQHTLQAQQITGVWKGKINGRKVEAKIIQKGDSLTGTSYYYESPGQYHRYSIKGYFDPNDNSVVWWDDQLIEEKGKGLFGGGKSPLLSTADFNCPGGGRMFLDGEAAPKEKIENKGPIHLTKVEGPSFNDEWDFVIDNYTVGANDPFIIDSVGLIAGIPATKPERPVTPKEDVPIVVKAKKPGMVVIPPPPQPRPVPKEEQTIAKVEKPLTIEEKFTTRQKVFNLEIPVTGDSIELRFYDNAEIDGDSISLFLNNKLLFQHIRLLDKAYIIKLATNDLSESNELVMVAENLGSIPPNTSYMVAIVGDKRYEAKLASSENSSAMIRLKKMIASQSAINNPTQ
ncbi:MAG: hypothetical protein ICV51_10435 [Flavisolibacter sp.]|nr:hypothetical protein [Flavisolibacter sp.]